VLRIVVRNGFTHDLAELLLTDLPRLNRQSNPQRGTESSSFSRHSCHRRVRGGGLRQQRTRHAVHGIPATRGEFRPTGRTSAR
jgi:glutamate decarboxylase